MNILRYGAIGTLVIPALLSGCSSFGPTTMPSDRLAYTVSVARSLEEQLLLNIVRTRYSEAPTFVDVSQIVAGYELQREGTLSSELHFNNSTDSFLGIGAGLRLTEKPTITYAPLGGESFARTVVAPIPPHLILLLIQSGWPADEVLALSVRSINGYRNHRSRLGMDSPGDPEFTRISSLLRELQEGGAVDFRVKEEEDKKRAVFLTVPGASDAESQLRLNELRKLLGIDGSLNEVPINVGLLHPAGGEVTLYTFSLLQMMVAQGRYVATPPNPTGFTPPVAEAPSSGKRRGMAIRAGKDRPLQAAVAVPYAGNWFWIDADDRESKLTMMALSLFYRLLESGNPGNLPVLTIPAG